MILVLLLASIPPEEAALRTLFHKVELTHYVAWKAERESVEELDRQAHGNLAGKTVDLPEVESPKEPTP